MRIGIIGSGLMGTSIAYFLAGAGVQVTLLEQGNEIGGLQGDLWLEQGLRVPRFQHTILPTDHYLIEMCDELGLSDELIFQDAYTGFAFDSSLYPLTNIRDFLAFPILSLADRLRLGRTLVTAFAQRDWQTLDSTPVGDWLERLSGETVFERIWKPLLDMKFDGVYDDIAATYVWAWLRRMMGIRQMPLMSGNVGYLKRGNYSIIQELVRRFESFGGTIQLNTRVREISVNDNNLGKVRTLEGNLDFDVVIAATSTPVFLKMLPGADMPYQLHLAHNRYLGLICPVLLLSEPLSSYWTLNMTDSGLAFSSVVEMPHPENPHLRIVYLPRYTAPDHDWMGVSDVDIRRAWLKHLKIVFPDFREDFLLHFAVSRSRYAEPRYSLESHQRIPAIHTPYQGLYLANTAQVYPDLPSSDATLRHAQRVAEQVLEEQT